MDAYESPKDIAKRWLEQDCLILDTETTGLGSDAEIVELALITSQGCVLINELVRPSKPIPADATDIHGITNEMVVHAPSFRSVYERLAQVVTEKYLGSPIVIYNREYDTRLILQSLEALGIVNREDFALYAEQWNARTECAMGAYAEWYGDWSDYRQSYKWQKLTDAASRCGVDDQSSAHRALADCLMTLVVIKAMANADISHSQLAVMAERAGF